MRNRNFSIAGPAGVSAPATVTSSSVAVDAAQKHTDVLIHNPGAATVFAKAGDSTVVATTLSMPIPAGALVSFFKGPATNIAVIMASGTGSLTIFVGEGAKS